MRQFYLGLLCFFWGAFAITLVTTGIRAFAFIPEPIAPPIPEPEEFLRVWSPAHIVLGVLVVLGCGQKTPESVAEKLPELPAKLTCRISDWSMTEDGDLFQATLLTSDNTTHKAIWFKVGKKLVFPQWFTHGKEAQKLPGDKLQEAWEARTPGVYKMEPPPLAFTNDLKSFGKEAKFD